MSSLKLGTRSWNDQASFTVGQVVYVPATYFDAASATPYSDCFPYKSKTLLKGKVNTISLINANSI